MFNIIFINDWIQTVDLWYWKQPLYQLRHNQFSKKGFIFNNESFAAFVIRKIRPLPSNQHRE